MIKVNTKLGYLGILMALATINPAVAEAQTSSPKKTISERLVTIHEKLREKHQQVSLNSQAELEEYLLAFWGDFGDSLPFSDFGDIIGPGFGDFGDSLPFGDFGDIW